MSIRQSPVPSSLLLAGAILAVYLPVCGFEFVSYDDGYNIYNNWRVTSFSADNLLYFWKAPYENLYIPLTYTLGRSWRYSPACSATGRGACSTRPSSMRPT